MQTKQTYQFLADLTLLIHFSITAFIVIGLLLIIIGGLKNWHWIYNPWFRYIHLVAVGFIVIETWLGQLCPLTYLENSLRDKAGGASYPGSFVIYWIEQILYYNFPLWIFAVIYSVFGLMVLIFWAKFRPGAF